MLTVGRSGVSGRGRGEGGEGERVGCCWLSANQLNSARYSNYPMELDEGENVNAVLRLFGRRLVLRQCATPW